jgi:hypothetical protein
MWTPVPKGYHATINLTRRYIMVTLSRTIGQHLKKKGQPIATPMLGEIKARRREGFHNRLASAVWKMSFQLGFWSPSGFSESQQLEFRHSSVLTAREKVRLEADLKAL